MNFESLYYEKFNPGNAKDVSNAQTLYIQSQLMDIREQMEEPEVDSLKVVKFNDPQMKKYIDLISGINFLDF